MNHLISRSILGVVWLQLLACGSAQTDAPAEPSAQTVQAATPQQPAKEGTVEATGGEAATTQPATTQPGTTDDAPASAGRMAFTQCDAEHRPEMCTKEYRPVCGEVDNGVRCITTPCDSTDRRTFGNACMACADPKTVGHWPVPCERLNDDAR